MAESPMTRAFWRSGLRRGSDRPRPLRIGRFGPRRWSRRSFDQKGHLTRKVTWLERSLGPEGLINRAPVRIFAFQNRVEIISPGHLPNKLSVENIKRGNSVMRNPILASYATRLLPYRGLGSGIVRVAFPPFER